MKESNPQFARILLGLATDEERSQAAEQILVHDGAYEDMAAQEQSLIDKYVFGSMGPDEAAALEAQARFNPELAGRISIQQALVKVTREGAASAAVQPSAKDARTAAGVFPYWARIAAMLILCAIPLVYLSYTMVRERTIAANQLQNWRVENTVQRKTIDNLRLQIEALQNRAATASSGPTPGSSQPDAANTEKELRRQIDELSSRLKSLDQQSTASRHSDAVQMAFMVLPENRGADTNDTMAVASTVKLVTLEFNLDNPGRFSTFSLSLSSAGHAVLEQHGLKARLVGQRWAVTVYVPADVLHSGSYEAVLVGVNGADERPLEDYTFQISRSE